MNDHPKTSPQIYARMAGVLFLVMMAGAMFGMIYVPSQLIVFDNATLTAENIGANEWLFRWGIIGHLVVLFTDVGLSVLLYMLLKPASKTMAMVSAVARLIMTAMRIQWRLSNTPRSRRYESKLTQQSQTWRTGLPRRDA